MAGATLTDDFWANDILWQISVFAYNISVMMRQKKNKFKKQEHRTFIDWFIAVPAKITRSGHQTELKIANINKNKQFGEQIKMYEYHFYKADWKEPAYCQAGLTGSSKRHKKQKKEENMETNPRVYGRSTFF